jgi:hypothetical protein
MSQPAHTLLGCDGNPNDFVSDVLDKGLSGLPVSKKLQVVQTERLHLAQIWNTTSARAGELGDHTLKPTGLVMMYGALVLRI